MKLLVGYDGSEGGGWSRARPATYWGTAVELEECLELARQGKIHAHVEHFTLEDCSQAHAKMRAGKLEGREVVAPQG